MGRFLVYQNAKTCRVPLQSAMATTMYEGRSLPPPPKSLGKKIYGERSGCPGMGSNFESRFWPIFGSSIENEAIVGVFVP